MQATVLLRRPASRVLFPMRTLPGLITQTTTGFGTLRHGLIRTALQQSNLTLFKELLRGMTLTDTNLAGIARVRRDGLAFVIPTNIGEYVSNMHPCDLTTRGRFLIDHGFGLVVPKGSGVLGKLNKALEHLDRTGYLDQLYTKWWYTRVDCRQLQMENMYHQRSAQTISGTTQFSFFAINCIFATLTMISVII